MLALYSCTSPTVNAQHAEARSRDAAFGGRTHLGDDLPQRDQRVEGAKRAEHDADCAQGDSHRQLARARAFPNSSCNPSGKGARGTGEEEGGAPVPRPHPVREKATGRARMPVPMTAFMTEATHPSTPIVRTFPYFVLMVMAQRVVVSAFCCPYLRDLRWRGARRREAGAAGWRRGPFAHLRAQVVALELLEAAHLLVVIDGAAAGTLHHSCGISPGAPRRQVRDVSPEPPLARQQGPGVRHAGGHEVSWLCWLCWLCWCCANTCKDKVF